MNNILTHEYDGTRWLFVEVPNDYFDLKVEKLDDCDPDDYLYLNDDCNWWKLPHGIWQIHSVTNTMTEEQASQMVKIYGGKIFDYDPKEYWTYEDYTLIDHPFDVSTLETPIESLGSLITSLGGSPDKNYVVLKSK